MCFKYYSFAPMHQSKVFSYLKTFSEKEWKSFEKFVQSPYFGGSEPLLHLLQYIRKWSQKDWQHRRLHREAAYRFLFPKDADIQIIKLQQLMSLLTACIEQFWVQQRLTVEEDMYQIQLAHSLQMRGLKAHCESSRHKTRQLLQQQALRADVTLYRYYELAVQQHQMVEAEAVRNVEPCLQEVMDSLDVFYCTNKLRYYCKALNFKRLKQQQHYNFGFTEPLLDFVKQARFLQSSLIEMYYCIAQTLLAVPDSEVFYRQFKAILLQNDPLISREEKQHLFIFAINFCIAEINAGKREYWNEVFHIYQTEIDFDLLLVQGIVPAASYRNIFVVAEILGELAWLDDFLLKHKDRVEAAAYRLNVAKLRFLQQRHRTVLQELEQLTPDDKQMLLTAKCLQIKALYELYCQDEKTLQYEDALSAHLVNFTNYLRRNKSILPTNYVYYLNFCKYLHRIIVWADMPQRNSKERQLLADKIQKTTEITEKKWLIDVLSRF